MVKIVKGALLAGVVSLAFGGIASASGTLTDAEFKCQAGVSKAGSKFVGSKSKCAIKCQAGAVKVPQVNPFSDCYAPYGGATAQCIDDTVLDLKGAEDKFRNAIIKACSVDCPECYSGGDCSASGEAGDRVQNIEGQVDSFGPGVFCLGNPGGLNPTPPTKEELACESNTAKVLSKLVGSINKCYDKCFSNARKGLISASTCAPPATDPATSACISAANGKSVAGVDKKCSVVGAVAVPDCNNDSVDDYPTGAAWTNLVDIAIEGNVPGTYCASPSGAFVE
jgi:hypothetical protein